MISFEWDEKKSETNLLKHKVTFGEALPEAFARRIKRHGVVNAWDDPAFAAACRDTGK